MAGDKLLVRNVRQENRKGGKMDPDMFGPFTIVKIKEKNDVVSTKGKKKKKRNLTWITNKVCGARASHSKKMDPINSSHSSSSS